MSEKKTETQPLTFQWLDNRVWISFPGIAGCILNDKELQQLIAWLQSLTQKEG